MFVWRTPLPWSFKNGPTPASFCLFSFFTNTNFTDITVGFSGIWTRIVGVEGKLADHLTTTKAAPFPESFFQENCFKNAADDKLILIYSEIVENARGHNFRICSSGRLQENVDKLCNKIAPQNDRFKVEKTFSNEAGSLT